MTPLWQRWAARLLARHTGDDRAEELVGELADDFARRRRSGTGAAASIWLVRELFSLWRAYRAEAAGTGTHQWARSLAQDVRYAVRGFRRTPIFTISTLLILTFGLGAVGAMFGLVEAVVLRPLPYRNAAQLVRVYETRLAKGQQNAISPPNFFDLLERTTAFESMAAFWSPTITATDANGNPERVLGALCSHSLFSVLGVAPALGRGFVAGDDIPGAARTAILSDAFWRRSFGADPGIVGRQILLDGVPVEVLAVMPAGFEFPSAGTQLWMPLRLSRTVPPNPAIPAGRYRGYRILSVVARIHEGQSMAYASADLAAASRTLASAYPESDAGMTATAVSAHDVAVGPVSSALLVLLGAVACVLLIACANVGSLFLVRGLSRRREFAIRLALGAGRSRLIRQLLTESALLSAVAGAASVAVASWGLTLLRSLALPANVSVPSGLDGTTVAVMLVLAAIAGALFGLVPALQRSHAGPELRSAGRGLVGAPHRRLRQTLVVSEVAISVVLTIGAALLGQSLVRLESVDPGFAPAGVWALDRLELPRARSGAEKSAAFFDDLLARIDAIPGVTSAGMTLGLPLDLKARFFVDDSPVSIGGLPTVPVADRPSVALHVVGGDYFRTVGVPLLRGRAFEARDRGGAPAVAIVNDAMARKFWPGQNPIGRQITHDLTIVPNQATTREIIGVVGDVRHFGLTLAAEPQMFIPHQQMPWPSMALVVRSRLDAAAMNGALREAVWSIDRSIPVPAIAALDHVVSDALGQPELRTRLLGAFAVAALGLALIGLYGTMAYSVHARRREMAVRMALGATPRDVRRLVLGGGFRLVTAGLALGVVSAAAASRSLGTLLYGVTSSDPATFLAVASIVVCLASIACAIPARRVSRINPVSAINLD